VAALASLYSVAAVPSLVSSLSTVAAVPSFLVPAVSHNVTEKKSHQSHSEQAFCNIVQQ
jgi:hypothetical protein